MSKNMRARKLSIEISEEYYKRLKIITINRDIQLRDLFMEILDAHFSKKKNPQQQGEEIIDAA